MKVDCNGKPNPLNNMLERKRPFTEDCSPEKSHKHTRYQEKCEEQTSGIE